MQRQQRLGQSNPQISMEPTKNRTEILLRLRTSLNRYRIHGGNVLATKDIASEIVLSQNRHPNPAQRLQFRFQKQGGVLRRGHPQYLSHRETHKSQSH